MTAAVLTVSEVADLFRCSPQTVYRSIESGELESVRLMGVVRIPVSALPSSLTQTHGSTVATPAAPCLRSAADGAAAGIGVTGPGPRATEVHGDVASTAARAPDGAPARRSNSL